MNRLSLIDALVVGAMLSGVTVIVLHCALAEVREWRRRRRLRRLFAELAAIGEALFALPREEEAA